MASSIPQARDGTLYLMVDGFVRTRIGDSGRNRGERYGPAQTPDPASQAGAMAANIRIRLQSGLDPSDIARQALTAIRENELYVFTHPDMRGEVDERFAAIQAALDKAMAR